jgi:RES domain-containing protein
MIFTTLKQLVAYRTHVPKWAVAPTSGAGAGTHGGRANRIGTNALYLALDVDTAVQEYKQVSTLLPPGTLVSYRVTAGQSSTSGTAIVATHGSRYGKNSSATGGRAGSTSGSSHPAGCWAMRPLPGAKGILFPSTLAARGVNLVLYVDQLGTDDVIEVFDPAGALPRNQDSWK